ncbi:MAG: Crp/Fnr family transcriptional regulator [Odoribacter sp.]
MDVRLAVAVKISQRTFPLCEESLCRLSEILVRRELMKNELFVAEGEIARSMGMVEEGIVRQFYRKRNYEVTEHITYEDHLFVCLESFIRQMPSSICVEALEPTVVYEIPYDGLHQLMEVDADILRLYCKILESSLLISQHKADARCRQTVVERYRKLEREHPEIIKRVPQIYIASLLGMTPETLSRIRAGRMK